MSTPSWFSLLRSAIRTPLEERHLRAQTLALARQHVEAEAHVLQEITRVVQPEHDGYVPIGGSQSPVRELTTADANALRQQAMVGAANAPLLIGYLASLQRFVMGQGVLFRPTTANQARRDAYTAWWNVFARANRWDQLEDEIPVRLWRDGEVFIRRLVVTTDDPMPVEFPPATATWLLRHRLDPDVWMRPPQPRGLVLLRLLDPATICDPDGSITHGILTDPHDVQTVLGYCFAPKGIFQELIPAEDIEHLRIRVDSDTKRGRSLLEPLLPLNTKYEKWLDARILLSVMRASVALVKKIEGTPTQVATIRNQEIPERDNTVTRGDQRQRMLRPGSTITAGPGIEYKYLSPDLQAADAQHDGREIKLNMAAAAGLPEYMFTGDSSNANYASTMVAEAPAVREFENWRDFLEPTYRRIWLWVMQEGARAGRLPGITPDEITETEVELVWQPLLARDELKQTQANEIRARMGVLSKESWALGDGLDWMREHERLQRERQEDVEFAAPEPVYPALPGASST